MTLLDDLKRQTAVRPPPSCVRIMPDQIETLMTDILATSSRSSGLGALTAAEFRKLAVDGDMRINGIALRVQEPELMPVDMEIATALDKVRLAEAWLESYAKVKCLPISVSIFRSGSAGRVSIQMRAAGAASARGLKIFLNYDGTRRDSNNHAAGNFAHARRIIDEAAAAYAARK